jgi:hypothetical protein
LQPARLPALAAPVIDRPATRLMAPPIAAALTGQQP